MKKKLEKNVSEQHLTLFEHLDNLSNNKKEFNPDDHKNYTNYMINRYISMCDFYVPLVNEINKYDIPKEVHYRYYFSTIPKRKQFFKYISKEKDNFKESRENIMKYFECGFKDANEYLRILSEEQIEQINKKFEGGKA